MICKFFVQGCCKFGNNCRFEHISGGGGGRQNYGSGGYYSGNYNNYNNYQQNAQSNRFSVLSPIGANDNRQTAKSGNQGNATDGTNMTLSDFIVAVIHDIEAADRGKQWPLSCFGFKKNAGNYPGLEDISPEELRLEAYKCQQQNNTAAYVQNVEQLIKKHERIHQEIRTRSANAIEILGKMHRGQPLTSHTTNVFAKTQSMTPAVTSFKFTLPQQPSGSFGTGFQQSATSSFGSPGQVPSFGSPSQPSSFGSPNPTPSFVPTSSTGPFGSPVNTLGHNSNSIPSWPVVQQQSQFGNIEASTPSPAFMSSQQIPSQGASFGGNSVFPTGPSVAHNPIFASSTNAIKQDVGSPHVSVLTSGGDGIAQANSTSFTSTPANSISANSFSDSYTNQNTTEVTSIYTALDNLNDEEREQFSATMFTPGKIPVRPPPKEFCF